MIVRVTEITSEIIASFQPLVPQLTASRPPPIKEELAALLASDASALLIARHPDERGPIVAALTLVTYRVLTGIRARIEDVVVEGKYRRQGIGEALTRAALRLAKEAGADGVALTSHPRRQAANRLYQKMGFKRWETNLYFYEF